MKAMHRYICPMMTCATAVKTEQNVDLENPGKIYYKDNYIFIVEELKGIHVYDNTDPSSPVKKAFVNLPGCG